MDKKEKDLIFSREFIYVDTADLCLLTHNYMKGLEHPEIGHLHASAPLNRFMYRNRRPIKIRKADVESFLFVSNLLDEKGLFFNYNEKQTFRQFVGRLQEEVGLEFDYVYNFFKDDTQE